MIKAFIRAGKLIFPADGQAPRLFLEWIRDTQLDKRGLSITVETKYCDNNQKVTTDWEDDLHTVMVVTMPYDEKGILVIGAKQYINDNL